MSFKKCLLSIYAGPNELIMSVDMFLLSIFPLSTKWQFLRLFFKIKFFCRSLTYFIHDDSNVQNKYIYIENDFDMQACK